MQISDSVVHRKWSGIKIWARALRLHQWVKNFLIFVPLLTSHQRADIPLWPKSFIAFFLFGLVASSIYIINDLVDLNADRQHTTKRFRPFASGELSTKSGLVCSPILSALSFLLAFWLLPWEFSAVLGIYFGLTLLYTFDLQKRVMIDVIVLAMLYTLRMIAGVFACGLALTFWMLAFSMFIFLSLALVKRHAELLEDKSKKRRYHPDDLKVISSLGIAAGYLAVLVLALYIQDQTMIGLYRHPKAIWLACPFLLYWIGRIWLLANRGQIDDDPLVFALKDRVSLLVAAGIAVVFWLAM